MIHAIRLAEQWAGTPEAASVQRRIAVFAGHSEKAIRYQAAFSLGVFSGAEKTRALTDLLLEESSDPWMRLAAFSAIREEAQEAFAALTSGIRTTVLR